MQSMAVGWVDWWRAVWGRLGRPGVVETGQGLVEYGLIILFVAIACVAAVSLLGETLREFFYNNVPSVLTP